MFCINNGIHTGDLHPLRGNSDLYAYWHIWHNWM